MVPSKSLRPLGVLLSLPTAALALLGLVVGDSPSGWLMIGGVALLAAGMIVAPGPQGTRRRVLVGAGAALLALVLVGRGVLAGYGTTTIKTLPGARSSRWLARAFDEQDAALPGALAYMWKWPLPSPERAQLVPAMHDAYVAMRASEGVTASPVLDTLLGRQRPESFDAIVIEPRAQTPATAVVFLHGYAGSYTLECWMMAEAARTVDALTVCPATSFEGAWWTPEGAHTLSATLAYVRERGVSRVYLAGLSNGGIGASRLAPRFASSLAGLILVSGTAPDGSTARLPALVLHGESDTIVSAARSRAFAARSGAGATYRGFDGGHFVMMTKRIEVRDAIAAWLARQAQK